MMNSLENLYYIPTLTDLWLSQDDFQTTLTTPLQNDPFSPLSDILRPDQSTTTSSTTPTSPSVSGSDLDTHIKQRITVVCHKKITKPRKSRAVNKNNTTFINATRSNFRHLVQQMTGLKSGLPTLATTPFSFDRCQEFVPRAPTSAMRQQGYFPAEGRVGFNNESFPTLESWGLEIE